MEITTGRQSAKGILENSIKAAESKVTALKALNESIKWEELTEEQEASLWSYFCYSKN